MPSSPSAPPRLFTFVPVQAGRASDDITQQIRAAMASGALRPGDRLPPERSLAVQFGVSRNTLREALKSLENSGVLALRRGAHSGAYLKQSDGQGVTNGLLDLYQLGGLTGSQLTEARILIETAIVRAACANCTPEDLDQLSENLEHAIRMHEQNRVEERIIANLEFHRLLSRATHNPMLVIVMNAILDVNSVFVKSIGPYDAPPIFASRRRFLAALRAGDADAAVKEMEASLRRLQRRYLSRLGK